MAGADRVVGALLLAFACVGVSVAFLVIGRSAPDALALTAYVVDVPPDVTRTLGFGGGDPSERVDVRFQGPEFSNVAFALRRDVSGRLFIGARDDEVIIGRTVLREHAWFELRDRQRILTRGVLGRAAFTLHRSDATRVRLELEAPIVWPLGAGTTRLTIGHSLTPVLASTDELYIRSNHSPQVSLLHREDCGLRWEREHDVLELLSSRRPPTGQCLEPGGHLESAGVQLEFKAYTNAVGHTSVRWVQIFGVRVAAALLLTALALVVAPHVPWRGGITVFGAVALLVAIAVLVACQNTTTSPLHASRSRSYLAALHYAVVFLFVLRVPYQPVPPAQRRRWLARLLVGVVFLVSTRALVLGSLEMPIAVDLALVRGAATTIAVCLISFFATRAFLHGLLAHWRRAALVPVVTRAGLALLPGVITLLNHGFLGGLEAIATPFFRIHLPTAVLPPLVLLLVYDSTSRAAGSRYHPSRLAVPAASLLSVGAYLWISRDTGGTVLLLLGVCVAIWVASPDLTTPVLVTAGVTGLGLLAIALGQTERVPLAWGGPDSQALYFDAATNLRLARDMARAGGWVGQMPTLELPAGLRANAHNDFIVAYIAGCLGRVGLFVVFATYIVFFGRLLGGVRSLIANDTIPTNPQDAHEVWGLCTVAMAATLTGQIGWVAMATLQRHVPFTGLDVPPLSISNISIVAFFFSLLGPAAITHTLVDARTAPGRGEHG